MNYEIYMRMFTAIIIIAGIVGGVLAIKQKLKMATVMLYVIVATFVVSLIYQYIEKYGI
jgi:predicted membrane channel-forming protein YqfA (hemolysin III family)